MPDPRLIYRLLLKLYPARFREEYSGPLDRQFRDDYRELGTMRQRGWLWLSALADLAGSIPAEIFREVPQDLGYALRVWIAEMVDHGANKRTPDQHLDYIWFGRGYGVKARAFTVAKHQMDTEWKTV
jgi:hypothetical protein